MKRVLLVLSTIMALLFCLVLLTSCNFDENPPPRAIEEHETPNNSEALDEHGVSPCKMTTDMVGQTVSVFGQIALVARDNPDGIFAELEAEGCKIGIFVPIEIWDQWDAQQQDIIHEDAQILASGRLVSFDGELIVDVSNPPQVYLSDKSGLETAESTNAIDQEILPEPSLDLPPAPAKAQLDVPIIYSGYDGIPGLCYLGAAAMLVKYDHTEVDFADVVALSGVGSSALHLDYPEMSVLSTRLADQSIVYMANNMGASYVLGY